VPFRAKQLEQARRLPAPDAKKQDRARQPELSVPPTAPKSPIDHIRSGAEQRARTTAVAILAAAQIGTSGALADSKHAGRRATWATPRTGGQGTPHLAT